MTENKSTAVSLPFRLFIFSHFHASRLPDCPNRPHLVHAQTLILWSPDPAGADQAVDWENRNRKPKRTWFVKRKRTPSSQTPTTTTTLREAAKTLDYFPKAPATTSNYWRKSTSYVEGTCSRAVRYPKATPLFAPLRT